MRKSVLEESDLGECVCTLLTSSVGDGKHGGSHPGRAEVAAVVELGQSHVHDATAKTDPARHEICQERKQDDDPTTNDRIHLGFTSGVSVTDCNQNLQCRKK